MVGRLQAVCCWISCSIIAGFWIHCEKDPSQLFAQVFLFLCIWANTISCLRIMSSILFCVCLGWLLTIPQVVLYEKTQKVPLQNPATHHLLPAHQLIVCGCYYCCLAMLPPLGSLYKLRRNKAPWVLWGFILRVGFWFISIIFHSLGKNKSLIFPYRFQFLIMWNHHLFVFAYLPA